MTLEAQRSLVNVNGVAVPGVLRNGAFVSEAPIDTFILFRGANFTANSAKSFFVEFPCTPRSILISDTNNNTTYTLSILTSEGFIWTMAFSVNTLSVANYGSTKLINFPGFVIDKGAKVSFQASNAISSVAIFAALAINIDVKDF